MQLTIPGEEKPLIIDTIILDLNGTLAIDGKVIEGVAERIELLRQDAFTLFLFTGDTHGNAGAISDALVLEVRVTKTADDKANQALALGSETCAAIGNGKIDEILFQTVRLSIATLQAEGVHKDTFLAADIVVPSINDALDLFIHQQRLVATLRR